MNLVVLVARGSDLLLSTVDLYFDLITATTSSKTSKNSGTTAVIEATDVKANSCVVDKDSRNNFFSMLDCNWRHNGSRQHRPEMKQ